MDKSQLDESFFTCEWPSELEDARDRLNQAKADFVSLESEIHKFLYEYVKGMLNDLGPIEKTYTVKIRHPNDSFVRGRPSVLVAQIAENLRAILDYTVFQLSKLNKPSLDERIPAFVIAKSKREFKRTAKLKLRYIKPKQQDVIEQLQPYNGNLALRLLRDITNSAKHRHLLQLVVLPSLDISLDSLVKQSKEYRDCFVYPTKDGKNAIFARYTDKNPVRLLEEYDAFHMLNLMISQTEGILWAFSYFFCPHQEHQPRVNVKYGRPPERGQMQSWPPGNGLPPSISFS